MVEGSYEGRSKPHDFEESQRQLTIRTVVDLLCHERHEVVRDTDETNAEYAARADLFGALLDRARHG